jgi:hypothetical protein
MNCEETKISTRKNRKASRGLLSGVTPFRVPND